MCLLVDLPGVVFNGEKLTDETVDLILEVITPANEIEHEAVKMLGSYFSSL